MGFNLFVKSTLVKFAAVASLAFAFSACADGETVVRYESHEVEELPTPSDLLKLSSSSKKQSSSSSSSIVPGSDQKSSAQAVSSSSVKTTASSSSKKAESSSSAKASSSSSAKQTASSSSKKPESSSAASSSSVSNSFFSEDWRQKCLEKINEYRATENLEPLTLASEEKQTCTDQQAADDLADNKAHGHFGDCGEGAQNSGPNFTTSWRKTATEATEAFLKMMWEDEKALVTSGERDPDKKEDYSYIGHYLNMKGNYKTVACGIALTEDGKKGWLNINFFRK